MYKHLVAVGTLSFVMFAGLGCGNKDLDKCLADADKYEAEKVKCLAITSAPERDACTSKNEVRKMTRQDCQDSYK